MLAAKNELCFERSAELFKMIVEDEPLPSFRRLARRRSACPKHQGNIARWGR